MNTTSKTVSAFTPNTTILPIILKYLDVTMKTWPVAANSNDDAYLLVLLAEQEVAAGRADQAHILLDAAYIAFDQTLVPTYKRATAG